VAAAHTIGLVALVLAVFAIRPPLPPIDAVLIGLAAGVAGVMGLAALYRELSYNAPGASLTLGGDPNDRNTELVLKKG